MRKALFLIPVLLCLCVASVCGQTFDPNYVDGNIYLKVKDTSSVNLAPYNQGIPALNLLLSTYGVDSMYRPFSTPDPALQKIYRLEFTNIAGTAALLSGLQALNFVEYAEKVPLMVTTYTPNDLQSSQWGLVKVQAPQAWDLLTGVSSIVVAVVDNAFNTSHEDLLNSFYVNTGEVPNNLLDDDFNGYIDDYKGYDVADLDGNVNPPSNAGAWDHGTHCAGVVGAGTDNGVGIAAIGFGVRVLPVKASADAGGGTTLDRAYEAVDFAISSNAKVISMSWGSPGVSATGQILLNVAQSRDIVLVAAAGNNNDSTLFYPAAYTNVLAVGATDVLDHRSGFSNYGSFVDVMAPGTDIYSALASANNAYGNLSGTSMACPLVAGLAGLLRSGTPLGEAGIRANIIAGCDDIDALNPGYEGKLGAGRINAFNSISMAVGVQPPLSSAAVTLYPNPARGSVHVRLQPQVGPLSLVIRDLAGRTCRTQVVEISGTPVDLQGLAPGCYLVELTGVAGRACQRLIVY